MADLNPINDDTTWPDKSNSAPVANRQLQSTAEDWEAAKARFLEIFTEVGIGATPPDASIKGRLALAAIKGPIRVVEDDDAIVTPEDNGGIIVMALATPDVTRNVAFPNSLPLKFDVTVVRTSANTPAGGGARVMLVGIGDGTHVFLPKSEIVGGESSINAVLSYKNEEPGDELASWLVSGDGAPHFASSRLTTTPTQVYVGESQGYIGGLIDSDSDLPVSFGPMLPVGFEITIGRAVIVPDAMKGAVTFVGDGPPEVEHIFEPIKRIQNMGGSATVRLISATETQRIYLVKAHDEPYAGPLAYSFTSSNYMRGTANTLRGNASGFTASAIIKMLKNRVAGHEVVFGNHRQFNNDGGWYIGMDSERFKFGVGNNSDGSMAESAGTDAYQMLNYWRAGGLMGKEFLLTLVFDGTTARFYVNGIEVKTITPSGGFRVSDSALYPMAGRGNNAGAPTVLASAGIRQLAYKESVMTADQVSNLYESCIYRDAMAFADWTNVWNANDDGDDFDMVVGSIPLASPGGAVGSLRARTGW